MYTGHVIRFVCEVHRHDKTKISDLNDRSSLIRLFNIHRIVHNLCSGA